VPQAASGNRARFRTIRLALRRCGVIVCGGPPMTPYDHAPPVSPASGEPGSYAPPPTKASGSQKRQRRHSLQISLDDEEWAEAVEKAQACGLSLSSYGRAAVLGSPGPRARRAPHVNAVELGEATAALNKAGNNLNQIAHALNTALLAGQLVVVPGWLAAAIEKTNAALDRILEITGYKDRQ